MLSPATTHRGAAASYLQRSRPVSASNARTEPPHTPIRTPDSWISARGVPASGYSRTVLPVAPSSASTFVSETANSNSPPAIGTT